jgi:hypothetical protein
MKATSRPKEKVRRFLENAAVILKFKLLLAKRSPRCSVRTL